jgi:hypothetical protein
MKPDVSFAAIAVQYAQIAQFFQSKKLGRKPEMTMKRHGWSGYLKILVKVPLRVIRFA